MRFWSDTGQEPLCAPGPRAPGPSGPHFTPRTHLGHRDAHPQDVDTQGGGRWGVPGEHRAQDRRSIQVGPGLSHAGLGPAGLSGGAVRPGILGHPQQTDPLAGAPAGVGVSGGCLEEPVSWAVGSSDRMENALRARDSATR